MPLGPQSLAAWIATNFAGDLGSTYKGKIDAISSIAGGPSGSLYVYPNSPASLGVLVDPGFNLPQINQPSPFLLNGGASPILVTLVAPGSNSYYATIYWDLTTNTAGVIYGASAVSPVPVLPTQSYRIALALVLLTTGQATVTASSIYDIRSWLSEGVSTASSGNVSGPLLVYPNTPAALSVLVNPAFNLPQIGVGSPFLLNSGATPITVALVAPGSNSYFATIYWDLTTSAPGVIYGATGISPTPLLPDSLTRIPIALVLLTFGQLTVVASNIYDVRTWVPENPLSLSPGAIAGNTTVNCNGAMSVAYNVSCNGVNPITITFSNLRIGASLRFSLTNTSGTTAVGLKLAATTPGGIAYSILTGNGVNMVTTGMSIAVGLTRAIVLDSYPGPLLTGPNI